MLAVVAFAALVAAGATLFGAALGAEGHGHGDAGHAELTSAHAEQEGHVEPGGAEAVATEAERGAGNPVVKVVSAFLIAVGAAALVPLALLVIGRGDPGRAERSGAYWLRVIAALISAGAAAIHFAVISEHLRVWWAEGAFFVVAAAIQMLWALAVLLRPSRLLYAVGAAGNVFLAATWIVSRTMGVPLGPEAGEPEPVGFVDAMATTYELVAVAALVALLFRAARVAVERPAAALARISWVVGLLLVPLTALALLDLVQL